MKCTSGSQIQTQKNKQASIFKKLNSLNTVLEA